MRQLGRFSKIRSHITNNPKLLSAVQASSSFKTHDKHMTPIHATPTFLTKALYLVTYVKLLNDSNIVKATAYTLPAYSY